MSFSLGYSQSHSLPVFLCERPMDVSHGKSGVKRCVKKSSLLYSKVTLTDKTPLSMMNAYFSQQAKVLPCHEITEQTQQDDLNYTLQPIGSLLVTVDWDKPG